MKKIYLLLIACFFSMASFGQVALDIYAGGGLPSTDSITGYANNFAGTRTKDSIASGTGVRGYGVFNLGIIPAGATINSCTININVFDTLNAFGGGSGYSTKGFAGDLSLVTVPATLYTDCGSGSTLTSQTYAGVGNHSLASTSATTTFISSHIGSKVSITFTSGGGTYYYITGESGTLATSGAHAPYIHISYCPPPNVGPTSQCVGTNITLSNVVPTGTWSSSNPAIASVGSLSGIVTGNSNGVAIISYVVGSCVTTTFDTVETSAAVITGPDHVCAGSTITLADAGGGGTWTSSIPAVATVGPTTGVVTGVTPGVTVITYTNDCGTGTKSITVNPLPGAIFGPTTMCVGNTITLTDGGGGTWTSGTPAVATIGSTTGVVTSISPGTTLITYTLATGCITTVTVTVVPLPTLYIMTGGGNYCAGGAGVHVGLSGSDVGVNYQLFVGPSPVGSPMAGTGSALDFGLQTAAGTYTVVATSGGGCTRTMTGASIVAINPVPAAITPSGPVSVCVGNGATLADATPSGTWSATNGNATVSGGFVVGVVAGVDTILYTTGAGCSASKVVTINTTPAISLPHNPTICTGSTVNLTNTVPAGVWASSAPGVATVAGGLVTGISVGFSFISYTVGACYDLDTVTVVNGPAAITPAGPVTVCTGLTIGLADATPGGTWLSGNTAVATVGSTGIVTGVAAGVVNISYTVGTCSVFKSVTVNTSPAPILVHNPTLCAGSTITLTDATPGGTWASGNTLVATITGGFVTAIAPGNSEITYTVGSCQGRDTVFVVNSPAAITPAGPVSVCTGSTTNLADATIGGVWSSSNVAIATVGSTGIVTGTGLGVVNISYTIGSCSVFKTVTVNAGPAAISPSATTVCTGATTILTDVTPGGVWTSSNPAVATIGSTGMVTGVTVGVVTISYATGGCTALATVTVNLSPNAGTISGPNNECVSSSMTLLDAAPGGVWSSSSLGVATVSGLGVVFGVSAGTATISYSVSNSCGTANALYTVTINASPSAGTIVGAGLICAGNTTVYTDLVTGGAWSASNTNATINPATGLLTAITPGIDTIKYTIVSPCGTASTTKVVTIGAFLTAGTITGPGSVCVGSAITLTDLAPGGIWSSSAPATATVAGGVVTGVAGGVTTISYTVTSGCGSASATHPVTVNPLPNAGSITGPALICIGANVTYTDPAPGGVWSVSNADATITSGGVLTPVSTGNDTITYTVTNGCGTAKAFQYVTIGPFLTAGTISGPSTVCVGSTITLTDPVSGGVWSSSSSSATVVGGVVTGVSAGVAVISYTETSGCGSMSATQTVTVNPNPDAGSISGFSALCVGTVATYTDAAPGGIWSMSNSDATITGGGIVNPLISGMDTISYTVSNSCGTAIATKVITISTVATAGTITGPDEICVGSSITLSDVVTGGTWTSSAPAIASVSGGVVTGLTTGVATISYTVTGGCGTAVATTTVTVSLGAVAGTIIGPSSVCTGTFTIYTDASPGGVWSLTNGNGTVSIGGVVTALTAGMDTLVYTISNPCGTVVATKVITITPFSGAGTISGPSAVCVGAAITLTDGVSGGTWSSSNSHATVSGVGVVTGATNGVDTISYTITGGCGTFVATHTVTISAVSFAGVITGPSSVCVGSLITLTDTIPAGAWSSSNGNATVTIGGIVTGILPGTDTISYTVTGGCGLARANKVITINSLPSVPPITGPSSVCIGGSITLADATAGGVWTSSSANATVGSSTGVVTGVTAGTSDITYTVTNACGSVGTSKTITINSTLTVSPISGPGSQCVGTTITLTDATPGGVWSSSAPSVASIGSSTGVATGVSAGTTFISYTVTSGGCTASAVAVDTVHSGSALPAITGASNVCVGSTVTLTDTIPGGTWSAVNGNATVSGGVVTGVTAGVDTIIYSVTTPCGTATSRKVMSINIPPVAGSISGLANVCVSSSITLTDSTGGGVWSRSNTHVTIGSSTGVVTGVTTGVDTISYTVTNACGSAATTATVTVGLLPNAGTITGPTGVCRGSSVTLTDSIAGGVWSATNTRATVAGGVVTGVTGGLDTIRYTVTNTCGSATASRAISVNQPPSAGSISGAPNVCPGSTITLSATGGTLGGIWSSSSTSTATVTSGGVVTGVAPGTVTITYTVSNSCGSRAATHALTVLSLSLCNTMVNGVTGVQEIKVYPNPATSILNIDAPVKVNVTILSLDGKMLIQQNAATSIDVSNLANGMYIIMIYDENNSLVKTAKFAKTE